MGEEREVEKTRGNRALNKDEQTETIGLLAAERIKVVWTPIRKERKSRFNFLSLEASPWQQRDHRG